MCELAIRIFENESQGRWLFYWKMTGECNLSTCKCVQKLALLSLAVCSRYTIVHFARTDERTDERTNILPVYTVQFRRNGVKQQQINGGSAQIEANLPDTFARSEVKGQRLQTKSLDIKCLKLHLSQNVRFSYRPPFARYSLPNVHDLDINI